MNLDRKLQLQILEYLKEHYATEDADINQQSFARHPDFQGNIKYLYEHGLVIGQPSEEMPYSGFKLFDPNINMNGLDLLEDDGGLSAILRTITVKFDAENIRSLIEDKIIRSSLPELQRKTLVEKIKTFSSDALKQVALKLLEKGLEDPDTLSRLIEMIP